MAGVPEAERVTVRLTGTDSNVFALAGQVSRALKRAGQGEAAKEMSGRLFKCESYDAALRLFMEYVEVE